MHAPFFRTAPLFRGPDRLQIRPTKYGLLFLLVLLGMLLGSANYGNNLGFLVTFMLAGLAVASLLAALVQVRRVGLRFARAQPVFAGQSACFDFTLQSEQPSPALELSFHEQQPLRLDIPANAPDRARLCLQTHKRGLLRPGPARLATLYPLGLFRVWRWQLTDAVCLVYPAPVADTEALQRQTGGSGHGGQGGPGVEEFKGLREYAPGDPLQRIAWKHSQRGQGLLTKEFEGQRGGAFVLDYDALAPLAMEQRLSRLCRLALQAHSLGEPFALLLPHQNLAADAGDAHLARCLKALALFGLPEQETQRHG